VTSLALCWIAGAGCTGTTTVSRAPTKSDLAELNVLTRNEDVTVEAREQQPGELHASNPRFHDQSIDWLDGGGEKKAVPLASVQSITLFSRSQGALEGLGLGALSGLALGTVPIFAFGLASTQGSCGCAIPAVAVGVVAAGASMVLGALVGALVGAGVGHSEEIIFDDGTGPALILSEPERFHAGVSVGAGTAYDLLGARLELGSNHWRGYVGIGGFAAGWANSGFDSAPGGYGFSAGARWYRHVQEGFFTSLNFSDARYNAGYLTGDNSRHPKEPAGGGVLRVYPSSLATLTATAGYRWRSKSGFTFELGAGAGGYRKPYDDNGVTSPTFKPSWGFLPDVSMGFGYEL